MAFDDILHEALADFLRAHGHDVHHVASYEESYEEGSTCGYGTCWFDDEFRVDIRYYDHSTRLHNYTYNGKFGDLIRQLK